MGVLVSCGWEMFCVDLVWGGIVFYFRSVGVAVGVRGSVYFAYFIFGYLFVAKC